MKALVTGASHGLGRASAIYLSRQGYDVFVTSRSKEELGETVQQLEQGNHESAIFDLAQVASVSSLCAKVVSFLGGESLDVFIHCASVSPSESTEQEIETLDAESIAAAMQVTASSAFQILLQLHTNMKNGSRVFVISSDWALEGSRGPAIFSAAKAALRHGAITASRAYAKQGVYITVLTPGDVATYDVDWEDPKWSLDDGVESVKAELNDSRILIADVIDAIHYVLSRKLAAVPEIRLTPLDPEYSA